MLEAEEKAYSLGNEEKNLFFCIRTKSKCMNVTVFNPAQLQVLDMMSFVDSPEALAELKKAISDYFAKQAQKEIDRLWESGELNEEKVENFYQLHERTPYK